MATSEVRPEYPLVVIAGPTASGKTALAVALAEKYDGEIICADSRTIYRGMDIGTAKPTKQEQEAVPHWGIDLVDPGDRFTVADFQKYARAKIDDIRARGKVPILVGGSGLYINVVMYNYRFTGGYDPDLRRKLMDMSDEELQEYCFKNNIKLDEKVKNKRRMIRVIERGSESIRSNHIPMQNIIVVGIATKKSTLATRITKRVEQMFEDGVVKEAKKLGELYGWSSEAMTGNIYPILQRYLTGQIDIAKAKELFAISDQQLAKRQMTWFRRDPHILWGRPDELEEYVGKMIARF